MSETPVAPLTADAIRAAVMDDMRTFEREREAANKQWEHWLCRLDAVLLPVAVVLIWILSSLHLPDLMTSMCDSAALAPNSLSAAVRLITKH